MNHENAFLVSLEPTGLLSETEIPKILAHQFYAVPRFCNRWISQAKFNCQAFTN